MNKLTLTMTDQATGRIVDPADYDHKAGVHATTNLDLFNARADRIEHFLDGLEQGWRHTCPTGHQIAPTVQMALNAIRAGLDVLGEVTEGHHATHIPTAVLAVAS